MGKRKYFLSQKGFSETDLDEIFKNGPRYYLTNDFVDGVLIWWAGGILQVNDQENLSDDNYYKKYSIKKYVEVITYVIQHVAGTNKIRKKGSIDRGYA